MSRLLKRNTCKRTTSIKLQRLQNAAASLVSIVAKYDHITPTPVKLHWLPVRFRVNFKIAMPAHKCIYGNAPQYLRGLIKVKSRSRYVTRGLQCTIKEDTRRQDF